MLIPNHPAHAAVNLEKYMRLPIVIESSYSPKLSWGLSKEITQIRKTDSKLLSLRL